MGELRVRKIQEFIKQEVSRIILHELKDPGLGFVTVTDARITGDLREATVYVSLFGSDEEKANTLTALKKPAVTFAPRWASTWAFAIHRKSLSKKIHLSTTV